MISLEDLRVVADDAAVRIGERWDRLTSVRWVLLGLAGDTPIPLFDPDADPAAPPKDRLKRPAASIGAEAAWLAEQVRVGAAPHLTGFLAIVDAPATDRPGERISVCAFDRRSGLTHTVVAARRHPGDVPEWVDFGPDGVGLVAPELGVLADALLA